MIKKLIAAMLAACLALIPVSCFASENIEEFEKKIEGEWEKTNETIAVLGDDTNANNSFDHSLRFADTIKLPNNEFVLTEDSTGLVYIVAFQEKSKTDTPTMGILTFSDDENTMVIKDNFGGILIYKRK